MKNKLISKVGRCLMLQGLIVIGIGNAWGGWTRVTSISEITSGGTFIIGYEDTAKTGIIVPLRSADCTATTTKNDYFNSGTTANSSTSGTINMSSVISTTDYEVYITSPALGVINIQMSDSDGSFYGATSGGTALNKGRLFMSGNSNETNLYVEFANETNNQFKLTAAVSGQYKYFKYNTGSPRFAFYNSAGSNIVFYKKTASYTITPTVNNSTYGSVSINGVIISASPNSGYRVMADNDGYTVTSGTATVVNNADKTFFVTPSSDCTVQINFEAIPSHTVTWSVNGTIITSNQYAEGSVIYFPSNPEDIGGKKFVGWYGSTYSNPTIAPTFITTPKMGPCDVTFYAVFATSTPGADEWKETSLSALNSSDIFVFSDGSYAMTNDKGTANAPSVSSITVSNTKITSNITNEMKWKIGGNAKDGYIFYPNGSTTTWLYCNTTAPSSSNNNLRVGTGDRKLWIVKDDKLKTNDTYEDRYICQYNNSDFRGYTNFNSAFIPKFYKKTASANYSDYSTTVRPKSSSPMFLPYPQGEFWGSIDVTISAQNDANIYYTLDGTIPTTSSTLYTHAINLIATTTIKAIAVELDKDPSDIVTAVYNKNTSIDPTVDVYNNSIERDVNLDVTTMFSSNSEGAKTYHITSTPTEASYTFENNVFSATTLGDYVVTFNQAPVTDYFNAITKTATISVVAATYKISATQPEGGTYTVSVGSSSPVTVTEATELRATEEQVITLISTPNLGYKLASTAFTVKDADENTISVSKSGDIYTFTMPAKAVSITANYSVIYTISKGQCTNGSIATIIDKDGNEIYETSKGSKVVVTATPNKHYFLSGMYYVKEGEETQNAISQENEIYSFTMPQSNVTVYATFTEMNKHNVTFSINGVNGTPVAVYEDDAITFPKSATAPNGYVFKGWLGRPINGSQSDAPTFVTEATMETEALTYYAVFAKVDEGGAVIATLDAKDLTTAGYKTGSKNDDKNQTWSYYASINNQTGTLYYGLNLNASNYNIGSPVMPGKIKAISFKAYNGSSSADRKLLICTSNTTAQPTSGDLAEITIAKSEQFSKYYNADLTSAGTFFQFYIYATAALGISEVKVTYIPTVYSNYCTGIGSFSTPSSEIYTTFYTTDEYVMPDGVKGGVVNAKNANTVTVYYVYDSGATVPAQTPLVIKGSTNTTYNFYKSYTGAEKYIGINYLMGVPYDIPEDGYHTVASGEGEYYFYKLTYNNDGNPKKIGFYWGAADGAAFPMKTAGKAYLALPTYIALQAKGFSLDDMETGIDNVDVDANDVIYNLGGQRINRLQKGINIVNGKEIYVK